MSPRSVLVDTQYNYSTGLIETRLADVLQTGEVIQNHSYNFDSEGNLSHREDHKYGVYQSKRPAQQNPHY